MKNFKKKEKFDECKKSMAVGNWFSEYGEKVRLLLMQIDRDLIVRFKKIGKCKKRIVRGESDRMKMAPPF